MLSSACGWRVLQLMLPALHTRSRCCTDAAGRCTRISLRALTICNVRPRRSSTNSRHGLNTWRKVGVCHKAGGAGRTRHLPGEARRIGVDPAGHRGRRAGSLAIAVAGRVEAVQWTRGTRGTHGSRCRLLVSSHRACAVCRCAPAAPHQSFTLLAPLPAVTMFLGQAFMVDTYACVPLMQ